MTLIVSLRIPDGIVIAGDSLATMLNRIELQGELYIKCPNCNHDHVIHPKLPVPAPATTFAYAQKIFPFLENYGVGTFGTGLLAGKSIYFAVRELEQQLNESQTKTLPSNVTQAAEAIGGHMHNLFVLQLQSEGVDIDDFPEDQAPLGFQVVGYDQETPTTVEVYIGKQVRYVHQTDPGCTVTGVQDVTQAIWALYKQDRRQQPPFPLFSLQDAIAYAQFLIETTALHQRFSSTISNVGGETDIALVTPFKGFKWMQQKELTRLLEE